MKDYLGVLVMWKVIPFLYIYLIKFSKSLVRYFSGRGGGL